MFAASYFPPSMFPPGYFPELGGVGAHARAGGGRHHFALAEMFRKDFERREAASSAFRMRTELGIALARANQQAFLAHRTNLRSAEAVLLSVT